MLTILLAIIAAILVVLGPRFITTTDPARQDLAQAVRQGVRVVGVLLILLIVASTSYVFVGEDETGLRHKIYFGGNLEAGAIIATNGEKGPQADILPPGFHFEPFLNVFYEVDVRQLVEIPEDRYGYIVAVDGRPMRPDQTYADPFAAGATARMVSDATYFLNLGGGQKGPQTSVLTPGKYRMNLYLWDVETFEVTDIPKGFVGVIKSNVYSRVEFGNLKTAAPADCSPTRTEQIGGGELAVPLVPVGCIGCGSGMGLVWKI